MTAGPSGDLRIGDAERERAQATLADHYAVGRLEHDEYSERLDRIWAARTRAELDALFVDLPGATRPYSTAAARRPATAPRTRGARPPVPLVAVLVVLAAVVVATNLPLILVGVGVWFFFLRGGGCGTRMHTRRW